MSLAIDRKPFNSILMEGQGLIRRRDAAETGRRMGHAAGDGAIADRLWREYRGEVAQAQAIMQKLGYSDANPLQIKIQTRNLPTYRDPSVLSPTSSRRSISSANSTSSIRHDGMPGWPRRTTPSDSTSPASVSTIPMATLSENYSCNSERNYTQYCNADVDELLAAQSRELDKEKRKQDRLGDRAHPGQRCCAADDFAQLGGQLLAALCQRLRAAR